MHDKYIYSIIKVGKQKKSETTIYIENYMVIFKNMFSCEMSVPTLHVPFYKDVKMMTTKIRMFWF